jgi:rhamnulokinase
VTEPPGYAAVDLGAESGRVMLGRLTGDRVELELVHRFPNLPLRLPDGLHWNVTGLFAQVLYGLGRVWAPLLGVGVDAWGVDYALLDEDGRLLGLPFHHRDGRTQGMVDRIHTRVPRTELYSATGIQTMPINTLFQLAADEGSPALAAARRIALIPDLLAFWLSGALANEVTAASTTGLLDARTATWSRDLIGRLGLPAAPFAADPVEAGTALGPLLGHHPGGSAPVHAVAGHDTASAFVAAPVRGPGAAVLSSGTWSLLGIELDQPVLSPQAAACNLTNERGVDGTTRLLRNVMGLWLVQECRRAWGTGYGELHSLAEKAPRDVPLFDPDEEALLAPGNMPARIAAVCRGTGQPAPAGQGEMVRSILVSLACKYRLVLERLTRVTGQKIDVVHVVGGGVKNRLLCALTADLTRRPVIAGPTEATALGNVLVQARARGELGTLDDLRAVAAASAKLEVFEPRNGPDEAEATYRRFLEVTGQRELAIA